MHVHDCLHKLNYLKHIETNIHFIYTYLFFPECRAITWSDNILSISYKREKNIIVTFILPGICRQIILHLDKLIFSSFVYFACTTISCNFHTLWILNDIKLITVNAFLKQTFWTFMYHYNNKKFLEISYLIWFVEKNENKIKSWQESTSHSVDIKHQFEW